MSRQLTNSRLFLHIALVDFAPAASMHLTLEVFPYYLCAEYRTQAILLAGYPTHKRIFAISEGKIVGSANMRFVGALERKNTSYPIPTRRSIVTSCLHVQ